MKAQIDAQTASSALQAVRVLQTTIRSFQPNITTYTDAAAFERALADWKRMYYTLVEIGLEVEARSAVKEGQS